MADSGKTILIVDDDRFLLDMYSQKFTEHGYRAEALFNGREAFDRLTQGFTPDVMLIDVVMPELDGLSLIKNIKERHLAPKAAIIILSNLGQQEDIEEGLAAGVDGYIIKANATPSEVVSRVEEIVKQKHP